jgi:hypothetical protein
MMERVGDRKEKMEGSCSTGQSPQWAVVPVEGEGEEEEDEEEERTNNNKQRRFRGLMEFGEQYVLLIFSYKVSPWRTFAKQTTLETGSVTKQQFYLPFYSCEVRFKAVG